MKVLFVDTQSTRRRYVLLNKNCSVRHDMPPYELLLKESPEVFETMQGIAIALGHPLNYLVRSYCCRHHKHWL